MPITWINEAEGDAPRFSGAFMTMRSYREPAGTCRVSIYFSARAVERLGLKHGERVLVGIDSAEQRLAFRPTLFGGNALKACSARSALECRVTLPLFNLPHPQAVSESDLVELADAVAVPFRFDTEQFRGWKPLRGATLRAAA